MPEVPFIEGTYETQMHSFNISTSIGLTIYPRDDRESLLLVKSILAIADTNDKPVVAEGIETDAIARTLAELNCEFGQGYGIAKPMPIEQYINLTQEHLVK